MQPKECERLKLLLAECGRGERFIVQGGDCAERFMDCKAGRLEQQLKLILQMGMVSRLPWGTLEVDGGTDEG